MAFFPSISRRGLLAGFTAIAGTLALPGVGLAQTTKRRLPSKQQRLAEYQTYLKMYGALPSERFPIPAVNLKQIDPVYLRKFGDYETREPTGTVIVDTGNRVLFLTLPGQKAIRYGIGIGRAGFAWSGRAIINHKKAWPTWTPPAEMIAREPELEEWRNGMPPSLENPLGARALYIYQDGKDTLYRLHGTGQPQSIGKAVSSGCVRLLHHDVIDLFNRVPNKTPIVVI
jgi:lipoprotein-anchoring transpeptidase ErfK/SrfK